VYLSLLSCSYFVVLLFWCFVVVLCILIFVCTGVELLPPGESPIAVIIIIIILLLAFTTHLRVVAYSFLRFRDHTQCHTTVGRTPLDEWSARRRDLSTWQTHNTYNRQTSMPPAGFESAIPAGDRPQTLALDRSATETGNNNNDDDDNNNTVYECVRGPLVGHPCFRGRKNGWNKMCSRVNEPLEKVLRFILAFEQTFGQVSAVVVVAVLRFWGPGFDHHQQECFFRAAKRR
jgi:hypothetical protein